MIAIRTKLRKLGAYTRGATAIEYGLICALIIIAAIGGIQALGGAPTACGANIKTSPERRLAAVRRAVDDEFYLLPRRQTAAGRKSVECKKTVKLEIAVSHSAASDCTVSPGPTLTTWMIRGRIAAASAAVILRNEFTIGVNEPIPLPPASASRNDKPAAGPIDTQPR